MNVKMEPRWQHDAGAESLLATEPYLAYRAFPAIADRPGALRSLHASRWLAAGNFLILSIDGSDGAVAGAIRITERAFESEHFGIRIAHIHPPLAKASTEARVAALEVLYGHACEELRLRGFHHVTASIDASDKEAGWALQATGARYVGTKISWMQALDGSRNPSQIEDGLRLEAFDRPSFPRTILEESADLIAWAGRGFQHGPFPFDLGLPPDRSQLLYQEWTRRALSGEWADTLIVARNDARILSFHSMMRIEDLSTAAGLGVLSRGIGATVPGYRGLFTALQRECAARRPQGASFLENETQASNIPSIQVFGRLGHRCIGSSANFHRTLSIDRNRPHAA